MKLHRIIAIFIRHFLPSIRELHRFIDIVYWPIFDIWLWGFTSVWVAGMQSSSAHVGYIVLTSLVLWQVANRAHLEVALNFVEELWAHNIVNLFSTPLIMAEWLLAVLLLGIVKGIFAFILGTFVVWLFYKISLLTVGWLLVPFFISLLMSGWILGFLAVSIMLYAGQRAHTCIWVIGWVVVPFSGVFYPVSILPWWAQKISYVLPTTYLFEGIRSFSATSSILCDVNNTETPSCCCCSKINLRTSPAISGSNDAVGSSRRTI